MPLRLLVDVTQYAHWPATSGVQRVLLHLARDWPGLETDARFGVLEGDRYAAGPFSALADVIAFAFRTGGAGARPSARYVIEELRQAADETVATHELDRRFDAYLLPEPSLREDNLGVAAQLVGARPATTFFIYFDALPLTHPQLFPRDVVSDGTVDRYHRAVSHGENVAFISHATRALFEKRIARRKLLNAIVARPGADGLPPVPPRPPSRPTFTVLGTVEPRKRHRLVLDAFEQLWAAGRDYRLVVLGSPGWEQSEVLERLRRLSATPHGEWIEEADDLEIATAISRSSAVLFTPHAEGYGLPPLEALAAGCPAIVSADLPALEDLSGAGQIRLSPVTQEGVVSAVETLADSVKNAEARRAIRDLRLPTWKEFATDVEHWIASVIERRRPVSAKTASG